MDTPFAQMPFKNHLKELDGKIVECKYELIPGVPKVNGVPPGKWSFMRVRTDKSYPNAYTTAIGEELIKLIKKVLKLYFLAVCKSITEPVTKDMLLRYIERHRFKDDSELMGPPRHK